MSSAASGSGAKGQKARIRLSDVAARAGVSSTTASFVLTGRGDDMRISAAVEQKVRAAAEDLGYRPNLMARSLRTQVTRTVGLISDTVASDPFAGEMLRGAIAGASERNHVVLIAETEGDAELEKQLVNEMLDRQVDGLIYASMFTREVSVPDAALGQPIVLANCFSADAGLPSVVPDERAAGRSAARVLLEAGHRSHIYLVGEPAPDVYAGRERLAGIEEALAEGGTSLAGIVECAWWPRQSRAAVADFLSAGGAPAALICMNDRAALGAYQALSDRQRRVPDEVSVVSFDDSDLAGWIRPALTSIALPHDAMGRAAVEMLLEPGEQTEQRRLPMPVTARDSVAAPR